MLTDLPIRLVIVEWEEVDLFYQGPLALLFQIKLVIFVCFYHFCIKRCYGWAIALEEVAKERKTMVAFRVRVFAGVNGLLYMRLLSFSGHQFGEQLVINER